MLKSDMEFAVWFAAAAEAGWTPLDEGRRVKDEALADLFGYRQPAYEVVASLARSASAMHDAVLSLVFSNDDRLDSTGMAEATLVRVAIESLATGLWLMLPDEDEGHRRYLSFMTHDVDDMLRFEATLTGGGLGWSAKKSFPEPGLLIPFTTSSIITVVDEALGTSSLRSWKLYSGLAHGRPWAHSAWRRLVKESDPKSGNHAGRLLAMLGEPVGMARRFLEVADLRRRFEGQTSLERERLQRLAAP